MCNYCIYNYGKYLRHFSMHRLCFFVEVLYGKKLGEELTDFESCTEEEA